jgi:sortase A
MRVTANEAVIDLTQGERPTPVSVDQPRSLRRTIGAVLIGFAAFVLAFSVFLFAISPIVAARQQRTLITKFRALAHQGPASTLDWQPTRGDPVAVLTIPRFGLDTVVIEGTSSSATMSGPGHLVSSPLPGRPGNSVVIGRRTTFGGAFKQLSELAAGDQIQVSTGVGQFTYRVEKTITVSPGSEDVIGPAPFGINTLTLVTSEPAYSVNGRIAVIASLDGDPAAAPSSPPMLLSSSETGMGGDPAAIGPVVLWAEALIAACVFFLWVRRHLSARVGWLLGAPLVIALSWATFLALARLMPATL